MVLQGPYSVAEQTFFELFGIKREDAGNIKEINGSEQDLCVSDYLQDNLNNKLATFDDLASCDLILTDMAILQDCSFAPYCSIKNIKRGQSPKLALLIKEKVKANIDSACFVFGFDDKDKLGRMVNEVEIVGGLDKLESTIKKYDINTIVFAIPSMPLEKRTKVLNELNKTGCQVKVIPFISDLVSNIDVAKQMRDINIDDLLGRETIKFDHEDVKELIKDKVVMVTGGGGSIGSELCRQIWAYGAKRLVIVDVYENTTYNIQQELLRKYGRDIDLFAEIVSITDKGELEKVFMQHRPDIIFHAAAHKHVPLMESEPVEAVKNNVFGTLNVVELAAKYEVSRFIMISTDKAVNPTNVMGATKRCC